KKLNLLSARSLKTERLEGWGLVQRCGLTPTDLLHVTEKFRKWPAKAAERMMALISGLSGMTPEAFIQHMMQTFEKELARELLKKQLAKDARVNDRTETELSKHLFDCILSGGQNGYAISATLEHPVIGIGAPAHYFLPEAGKRLNGKVIIPEDADVANALGAVSSHVMIKQEITIQPGDTGGFRVEGIKGAQRFKTIEAAEDWAVDALKDKVRALGRFAGTSRQTVEMEINDRVVTLGNQSTLFLGRTIRATLSGSPDLVLETARSA
ncbi:MAG: hydantoinase/oxoprolinase, partial [Desulfobacterales bacterium]|nr:hydantoinase/oxoprolinase [Desulfobacterales bacterium]